MAKIRRRKGNRQPVVADKEIVILVYGGRINGAILDATDHGLGIMVPSDTELEVGQKIRIVYRRQMQMAKVIRIEHEEEGVRVGIRLST